MNRPTWTTDWKIIKISRSSDASLPFLTLSWLAGSTRRFARRNSSGKWIAGYSKDDTRATSRVRYPAIRPPIAAAPPTRIYLRSRTTFQASDMAAAITQNLARFLHSRAGIINGVWQSCWESRIIRHPALHLTIPKLILHRMLTTHMFIAHKMEILVETRENASIQLRTHN